jgi:hypothetical protein
MILPFFSSLREIWDRGPEQAQDPSGNGVLRLIQTGEVRPATAMDLRINCEMLRVS